MAHNGTLFLDELGEMSLRMQALLLRFVETRRNSARRLGSHRRTRGRADYRRHQPQSARAHHEGEFREDLVLPAQCDSSGDSAAARTRRGRRDPAAALPGGSGATHRVEAPRLAAEAQEILTSYRWPGNVRELKNVVERMVVRHARHARSALRICRERFSTAITFAPVRPSRASSGASENARRDRVGSDGRRRARASGRSSIPASSTASSPRPSSAVDQGRTAADTRQLPQARGAVPDGAERLQTLSRVSLPARLSPAVPRVS